MGVFSSVSGFRPGWDRALPHPARIYVRLSQQPWFPRLHLPTRIRLVLCFTTAFGGDPFPETPQVMWEHTLYLA